LEEEKKGEIVKEKARGKGKSKFKGKLYREKKNNDKKHE
jgi:hypothetical protein